MGKIERMVPYFLDFFLRVLLILVLARTWVQFKGGSISLGSACSLECYSARALCYNMRSSLLLAMSAAVSVKICAAACGIYSREGRNRGNTVYLWPKTHLKWSQSQNISMAGASPSSPSRCVLRAH